MRSVFLLYDKHGRYGMEGLHASLLALLGVTSAMLSCVGDPVRERNIGALGDEAPEIPVGPLHRAGQPCGLCHGEGGPAKSDFALSGTLYRTPSSTVALDGATVRVIDWTGQQVTTTTNCAGNFFIRRTDFNPKWPVWTKVELGEKTAEMSSAIFREASCGTCHSDPAGPTSVGHVYFAEEGTAEPGAACR